MPCIASQRPVRGIKRLNEISPKMNSLRICLKKNVTKTKNKLFNSTKTNIKWNNELVLCRSFVPDKNLITEVWKPKVTKVNKSPIVTHIWVHIPYKSGDKVFVKSGRVIRPKTLNKPLETPINNTSLANFFFKFIHSPFYYGFFALISKNFCFDITLFRMVSVHLQIE